MLIKVARDYSALISRMRLVAWEWNINERVKELERSGYMLRSRWPWREARRKRQRLLGDIRAEMFKLWELCFGQNN